MKTKNSKKANRKETRIIQDAEEIADLFTKGDYVTAQCKLVDYFDVVMIQFSHFSEKQKIEFSYLIKEITESLERRDYYAVADFLQFELPYILELSNR